MPFAGLFRLVLELEYKYGLLGEDSIIDPQSGAIKGPATFPVRNGKGSTEQLLSAMAEKAA